MRFDLLKIWEQHLLSLKVAELTEQLGPKAPNQANYKPPINDTFVQASINFSSSIKVEITDNTGRSVQFYDQLPSLSLTTEEQAAVNGHLEVLKKNVRFYDGDQMLITAAIYDTETHTLQLSAVQLKYSLLATLLSRKLPSNSQLYQLPLYKTGVLAPFITQDNYTAFMQRKDSERLYSAAGGFLEAYKTKNNEKVVDTYPSLRKGLVEYTAEKEIEEEFLGDVDNSAHSSTFNSMDLPVDISSLRIGISTPVVSSLSLRKKCTWRQDGTVELGMGTLEFIAPTYVHCDKAELSHILATNRAKDKDDHTSAFSLVPLDPYFRKQALEFLKEKKPGSFLYEPMLLETSRIANQGWCNNTPITLPDSRTLNIPVEAFAPRLLAFRFNRSTTSSTSQVKEQTLEHERKTPTKKLLGRQRT